MKTKQLPYSLALVLLLAACAAPSAAEVRLPSSTPVLTAAPTAFSVTLATVTAPAPSTAPSREPSTAASATAPVQNTFTTPLGDLTYVSARFVEEVNGTKPAAGCRLLLVLLKRADGAPIDLQQFHDANMQIFIHGQDGSDTLSTMGGFVGAGFAIGFQLPETVTTYRLVWGENPPLEIFPAQ